MERTELKGDLNVPYRFTEEPSEAEKIVAGKEGERKAEDMMETGDNNWVREQEKDTVTHKSKDRESLKRTREERDASEHPSCVEANGFVDDERKSGKGSDDRKVVEKDKERAQEREERDKEVSEGKKPEKEELNLEGASGVREKEKNSSSGIHQKKRLLRPRGHAMSATMRSRHRPKESEGCVSVLLYYPVLTPKYIATSSIILFSVLVFKFL